jgi:protein gp37
MVANWRHEVKPPANVWIGTTVEDKTRADERIPELLNIPAHARFLSCEPLLGPVEFSDVTKRSDAVKQLGKKALAGIHWVICGGESGPGARPMHPDWARSLRDQCAAVGVPFLFKQWGEWGPNRPAWRDVPGDKWTVVHREGKAFLGGAGLDLGQLIGPDAQAGTLYKVGKAAAGRLLDGAQHNGFPEGGAK